MSNESGEKEEWNQLDHQLKKGWYVMKMDGHKFSAFRLPNIELPSFYVYYEKLTSVVREVFHKFKFFQACYILDDEFHFLFHTNDVEKNLCRVSKVVVLPASYVTARVNDLINESDIESRKPINTGKICYDGRLIKLSIKEIIPYFDDLINHGKMVIGNITVGDGKYFVQMTMEEILNKAKELRTDITNQHSVVFGRLIDRYGEEIVMNNLDFESHKKKVLSKIKSYRPIKKQT